jgi:hypothetical protein
MTCIVGSKHPLRITSYCIHWTTEHIKLNLQQTRAPRLCRGWGKLVGGVIRLCLIRIRAALLTLQA